MTKDKSRVKKRKVAWGITGSGDKIAEIMQVMKEVKNTYKENLEIHVFISKAAEKVLKYYRIDNEIRQNFGRIIVEIDSNSPFLAGWLQTHKYEFLLIAPASSNTVAKIAHGIGDTLLTNSAIQSLKAFVQVYIVPTDLEEKTVMTLLPSGKEMKIRIRKEDAENTRKLEKMEDVTVLGNPQKICKIFEKWFKA